jgi:hypothetical protein
VTTWLLDENVLRELRPGGNAHVQAWYATVSTTSLRISAMTLFEKRRGAERLRKTDPDRATRLLAGIDALEAAYGSRIIPIDGPVVAEWARLLGAKDKNQRDRAGSPLRTGHAKRCRCDGLRRRGPQPVRRYAHGDPSVK